MSPLSLVERLSQLRPSPVRRPVEVIATPYVAAPVSVRLADGSWREFVSDPSLREALEHGLRMGRRFYLRPADKDW